jgi:hypothetical protein
LQLCGYQYIKKVAASDIPTGPRTAISLENKKILRKDRKPTFENISKNLPVQADSILPVIILKFQAHIYLSQSWPIGQDWQCFS